MIWIDYVIIAIVALSALISVFRGFMREALSLAGWVIALWLGFTYAEQLAFYFSGLISVPSVRLAVAFGILFLLALLLAGLVNHLAVQLVRKTGLSGTDRMLGIFFGIARGAVIVAVLVLLAGLTALPADPWWKESTLIVHFEKMAIWIRDLLPASIRDQFQLPPRWPVP